MNFSGPERENIDFSMVLVRFPEVTGVSGMGISGPLMSKFEREEVRREKILNFSGPEIENFDFQWSGIRKY